MSLRTDRRSHTELSDQELTRHLTWIKQALARIC